jgi:hypothetical protein
MMVGGKESGVHSWLEKPQTLAGPRRAQEDAARDQHIGGRERGLEALLKAELTVLLERESEAGETNSRNGYRQRGPGQLGLRVPRDPVSAARWRWNPWPRRCSWPACPRGM